MDLFTWLEGSAFSTWVREAPTIWAFSTILTLHTFGMGVLVGASALLDLRLLGIGRTMPLGPAAVALSHHVGRASGSTS